MLCVKYLCAKKGFKNPLCGKEELGEQEIIQLGPVYRSTDVQQPEEIIQFCPVNTITDVLEKHLTHTQFKLIKS